MLDPRANFRQINAGITQGLAGIENVVDGGITVAVNCEVPALIGPFQRGGSKFLG